MFHLISTASSLDLSWAVGLPVLESVSYLVMRHPVWDYRIQHIDANIPNKQI